jgi:hypothetical protein
VTGVLAFDEMEAAGEKPSSTCCSTNHGFMRKHVLPRVLRKWSLDTGLDETLFPFSEDEVATSWEEWRKTNSQYIPQYREQLGLPPEAMTA